MRILQNMFSDQFEKFQFWSQDVYLLDIRHFGYPHFLIKEVVGECQVCMSASATGVRHEFHFNGLLDCFQYEL